ncbi:hypothetical protein M5K25_007470 [Dendrobium thyrsiflorum]|uniref:Nucleolar 27S pre-rRNA processing Urb2/Npa2 C-terminal domain-containing protein n=1 Tax=Dendrobium thyrsiflorum TaxID=117978 RepID=A0ABD0VEG0_DENTH
MACSHSTVHTKSLIKRKKLLLNSEEQHEEDRDEGSGLKKIKLCESWENLDLILTLQSKDIHLQRKIEASFDFASSKASDGDGNLQPVSFSRALRYVFDWMQSLLMSTDRNRKSRELLDPCLDYRCWAVIRSCSEKFSVGASPNLFRAVMPVLKQALLLLDANSIFGVESSQLFENTLQCLSSLLASNSRAFYNVGVDLWISCVADVLNIVSRVSSREKQAYSPSKTLLDISALLLEHFASFLRFHPNPKNIFRVFVERLLEQLFEVFVLVQLRTKDSCCEQFASMLKIVEDVMLNGLFHPAHISGFLSSRSSTVGQEGKSRVANESYHRHLYRKVENVIQGKKVTALGGFACLLRLFASKVKGQQGASLSFRGHQVLKKGDAVSGDAQEASMPLFEVFIQFMKPLLDECKHCAENELSIMSGASEHRLVELHCMLRSVNETLDSFIQEKIYVRTEDTTEGKHYCFLKEIYDRFYSISIKLHFFWLSELQMGDEVRKMLPLIAREIFVGVGYFLEIEYRVFGDDLVIVWLMLLSFLAVNISSTDAKPCSLLMNEILSVGCKLINVYSELRQVNAPLFALCRAVRFLINTSDCITDVYKLCLEAAKALVCSQDLRLTIANAVKSVPEGQASNFIQQLNLDIADALEWIRQNSFSVDMESLVEDRTTNVYMLDMDIQAEVLGRILSEIYATVLEFLSITATNSISIGNSLKNLIKTLRPSLSCFLQTQSDNVKLQSMCWLFLFFFRLYVSSRSLYKQSISLMPPDLSYKASESLGDLFTTSSCMDWVEKSEKMDGGYFSWIATSSISLPEAIKILSEDLLSSSFAAYAPLVYILQVITIQRLSDLSRLIKAFEFFHKKAQMQLQDDTTTQRSMKVWKRFIARTRKEAVELTNFMTGTLSLLDSKGPFGKFDGCGKTSCESEGEWDRSVCSLDEKSLHVAIWWLFCQNFDVWCAHSTKKHLKKFVSYLFLYSLPCGPCLSNRRDVTDDSMKKHLCHTVTLHRISLELLQDTNLYELMTTYTNFSSRFCHLIKKLLSPILLHNSTNNLDLRSLPNWVEFLNILEKGSVMINADDGLHLHDGSSLSGSVSVLPRMIYLEHSKRQPSSSFSLELKACENLFNLFCKMPKFYCNAKLFSRHATYMLNIERLLLSNLLNHQDESYTYDPFELLRLFVSCRRAMKYLVMGSAEKLDVIELRSICVVFDCSSSILWLFKSVYNVAGLPNAFFGERDSSLVQGMIYSLIDHTSYVLLKISEAKACATLLFLLKEMFNKDQMSPNHHGLNDNDSSPRSFQTSNDWEHVELIAEVLKEHAEKFYITFKSCVHSVNLDACSNSAEWNKFSSVISCFQALLLGLASASDSMFKEMTLEIRQISSLMLYFVSKLSSHIAVFDDLINLCLKMVVLDDRQVIENVLNAQDDTSMFDCAERTLKLHAPIGTAKLSCCPSEHTKKDNAIVGEEIKSFQSASGSASRKERSGASTIRKQSSPASHMKWAIDFFHLINKFDMQKFRISSGSLLPRLLNDMSPQVAFILRQLFTTSATILRIKCMPSYDIHLKDQPYNDRSVLNSTVVLFETSYIILQELSEMIGPPCWLSFAWLDGVLTFFEVVGSLFNFVEPDISKDVYTHLIDLHLKAMGKCISLQGKTATLSYHDMVSDTKMLEVQNETSWSSLRSLEHGKYGFVAFKTKLRMSIKKYIMIPSVVYLKMAIQVIERKLVGLRQDYTSIYELNTGNMDGGMVSSDSAASIECFELILETFSGASQSGQNQFLKKSMPNLVGAIINIVLHLQKPSIFYVEKFCPNKSKVDTDAGAVILKCIEVLTKVVGRRSFHMDSSFVSQYFHIPMALFAGFRKLMASRVTQNSSIFFCNKESTPLAGRKLYVLDHQFSIELYTSCCRLMCSTIKNQKSEAERCIHLLEESLSTLLSCLEVVDSDTDRREGYVSWELGEAIKCASFLRRIYEEIRHQKDVLGKYAFLLLSNYISIFSGCGPSKGVIRREIDEALRPGVYSLIDICTRDDLQQLHSLLSGVLLRLCYMTTNKISNMKAKYNAWPQVFGVALESSCCFLHKIKIIMSMSQANIEKELIDYSLLMIQIKNQKCGPLNYIRFNKLSTIKCSSYIIFEIILADQNLQNLDYIQVCLIYKLAFLPVSNQYIFNSFSSIYMIKFYSIYVLVLSIYKLVC